jgi:NADH-quinone oxidoreductase subunit C
VQDCPEAKDTCVLVPVDKLYEVMKTLRDAPGLQMDFLNSVTGVDLLDLPGQETPVLRSVYHLYSYSHRHELVVMVDVDRADPLLPSLAPLWDSAIWLEREAFDLVGLIYEGHPNLTRILLPSEFEGFPLRSDWVESEYVMGIETQRDTPMELLKFFHEAMGGEAPPELATSTPTPEIQEEATAPPEAPPEATQKKEGAVGEANEKSEPEAAAEEPPAGEEPK